MAGNIFELKTETPNQPVVIDASWYQEGQTMIEGLMANGEIRLVRIIIFSFSKP
ncbi:hypothetical protein V2K60_00110 [Pseudomonas alliivorans]|nr:hypothetical protein [Pseudomonas alliivorans]